ncbi:MAG TPA: glycosyltransferase family 39 protein [Ramlibacter sp.]|nr:glycosyltransferase family 39 protein [Ramlibacter sp.]
MLSKRPALLWVCMVAWFAGSAWVRPLAMPDEGRYLSVAWEMLASGNWLVPTLDGLPFLHKPPLFYWLADAAMSTIGPGAFAGRIPSILSAATLVWGFHRFDAQWRGAKHALVLVVVLATTPYLYFAAQYANMDMLVAACISGAVLCAAHSSLRITDGRAPGVALPGAYVLAALGVLSKGLIGCALPAAIIAAWLLASGRKPVLLRLLSPVGIAVFLALVLPWPLAMQARFPGFYDYFIVEQHIHRFTGTTFNNAQPWWFYLPVVFVMAMPWSFGLMVWRRKPDRPPADGDRIRLLMICWLAVVVAFFSVPQSKLIGYALPAAPPLAWLLADGIAAARPTSFMRRHLVAVAGAACALLLVAVISYGERAPHSARQVAAALAEHRAAGEPVVFVDTYPYDLEFELKLTPPIPVVQAWGDPALMHRDSWPKELLDAGRFKPGAAAGRLVERVPGASMATGRMWVVSPAGARLPADLEAIAVARTSELTLWETRARPTERFAASY